MGYNRYIVFFVGILWINVMLGQSFFNGGLYVRANMSSPDYEFIDFKNRFGGDVGIAMETGWKWGYLEYGIGYSNIGMKYESSILYMDSGDESYSEKSVFYCNVGAHYIDIPAAIAFRLANKKEFGVSIDGGGYLSVGVTGKIKLDEYLTCNSYNMLIYEEDKAYSMDFFGDKSYQYKRMDAGWKVGAKIHLGRCVRIGMEYRRGLINLSNLEGTVYKNRVFNLSLLLMFGHWGK